MVDKKEFFQKLKQSLEISSSEIDERTVLVELPEYDSVSVITLLALVDEQFGKRLSTEDLSKITTVRSLIEIIGEENFT